MKHQKVIRILSLVLCLLLMVACLAGSVLAASTTLSTTVPDHAPPEITIELGSNQWKTFLNTITFGLFFKGTQKVTITAEDDSGMVAGLWYLTSSEPIGREDITSPDLTWTAISSGGSFTINPEAKLVVYAKATDADGNTGYVSSDGLVVGYPELMGDADLDHDVDLKDVSLLFHYVVHNTPIAEEAIPICDMDGDGELTLKDAYAVFRVYQGY